MKAIQPFTFDSSIDVPSPNYDLMKLNNIYNKPYEEEHKPFIEHTYTSKDNKVNIDINTDDKDNPFKLKLDLFVVDLEIRPKFDRIFNLIGKLF